MIFMSEEVEVIVEIKTYFITQIDILGQVNPRVNILITYSI